MRGKGEGSIYRRRSDDRWVGQVELPRGVKGERKRARVVRNKRADVVAALDELRYQMRETGGMVPDRSTRLGDYLNYWLTDIVPTADVSQSTIAEYDKRIRRIVPALGHIRLSALTVPHVRRLAVELSAKYAPKTSRTTLETLRAALRSAEADELIFKNPASLVSIPRTRKAKIDDSLTNDEAEAFLKTAADDDLEALFWLAVNYGLRLGELLDLRWADVDFDSSMMTIRRAKTQAGVRDIPLVDEAVSQLRTRFQISGKANADDLVFARADGRKSSPQMTRKRWNDLLRLAGIEHRCRSCNSDQKCSSAVRRFHASRHTAATLLLNSGVPLEVVSAILGHSSITVTSDIYAKVRSDLKRQALEHPMKTNET